MRSGTSRVRRLSLAILTTLLITVNAVAQTTRVNGVVIDDTGKPVKAATVTAQHPDSGQTFTATTDAKGHFTVIGLRPGRWRFVAEAPGHLITGTEANVSSRPDRENSLMFTLRRGIALAGPLGAVAARDLQDELSAADALFAQRKWDDALKAYRDVLVKAPPITTIHLQIAAVLRAKGDYDGAVAAYQDVLKIDPQQQRAQIGIGETRIEQGNPAAAEAFWMQLVDAEQAGSELFFRLGEFAAAKGDRDAARWYRRAATADPSWGKPLYRMGMAAIDKGDRRAAADYLTRAITVDPMSPEAALAKSAVDQLK